MEVQAAVAALSHLGINDAQDSVSGIPDGGSTLLRSEAGSTVTLLRRQEKYDVLVVGAQPDCPVPALRAVLETAVLPLSDDYAARIGVALPERDALRKRIREASVALDVIAQGSVFSVSAPKIPVHKELEKLVGDGATSVDHLPENFADDLAVLNQLQANVIVWSKEVDRLVQTARKGPEAVLSAEEETVFWSTLEAALSGAQKALSSKVVKLSLDILARKRRATGFLIDANNSLDGSRRKAAGVLTLIQGLPIIALRTAEDLSSLRKGVEELLEHIVAKLRISSFPVERMLSLLDSMGSDVNRSIGRILAEQGDILRLSFTAFHDVFESCCELFESWSQGFDNCRRVAREAARKKNEPMPPRRRSPLSSLYNHLTEVYELRSDLEAIRKAVIQHSQLSHNEFQSQRIATLDSAFSTLADKCKGLNHFDLGGNDEAKWIKLRAEFKSELSGVEEFLARDYVNIVRRGRDMQSLKRALEPFAGTLEKPFMGAGIGKVLGEVVKIGRSDLRVLEERARLRPLSANSAVGDLPPICITLSESSLLSKRAAELKQYTEKVVGKAHMEATQEVVEFISEVEMLRDSVNPYQPFKTWLGGIDVEMKKRPLLRVTQSENGNDVPTLSLHSSVIWIPRILQMARENAQLGSLLTSRHQELSRFAKAIVRPYSVMEEAMACFNSVSKSIYDLDDMTRLRVYPLIESLQEAAQDIIEEGFSLTWDSPMRQLQEYSSSLVNACGHLWNCMHSLLENDAAFAKSYRELQALKPILDRTGMLCETTQTDVYRIFKRMNVAGTSLRFLFSDQEFQSYLSNNWVRSFNSAVLSFLTRQTREWFVALGNGGLTFEMVTLDAFPDKDGKVQLSLIPSIADVELSLIETLATGYNSFAECVLRQYESVNVNAEDDECALGYALLSQSTQIDEQHTMLSSEALGRVSEAVIRILRQANEWNQYLFILRGEMRCDPGCDISGLKTCKDKLKEFTALYEDITSLREKDESPSSSEELRVLHDSRILSAKLLAKVRTDLLLACNRTTSAASETSQDLYKTISETKRLLANLSGTDPVDSVVSLQVVSEETIPSCNSTLQILSALEDIFDHIVKRTGDSGFACAESAEAWILSESLNAHFKSLMEDYERRRATTFARQETLREKCMAREELFRNKLTSLFQDFQNIRNETSEEETFIDTESLVQDLEHQLNTLDAEGQKLKCLAKALGLARKPDVGGPRDILVELKRVKEGQASLALIEANIQELSKATLREADPPALRDQLNTLSEKVDNIALTSGAKSASKKLQERISRCVKGLSIFGALKSVRLSLPRERELLKRLLPEDHASTESVKDLLLAVFWDVNLRKHEAHIRQVLENAAGEASLCDFITTLERTWTGRKCNFRWHEGVAIMEGVSDILDELDEHLQALETMASSQYAKIFESDRLSWEKRLGKCREELESLVDVQGRWAHINTLFGTQNGRGIQGLRKELQDEFSAFSNVHARLSSVSDHLRYAPGLVEGTESSLGLGDMKRELQGIVRGLSRFLEQQRARFPRFFFLPDDDLLQVLSIEFRNMNDLQAHIGKLFPGVQRFEHRSDGRQTEIVSVSSREGELLTFTSPILIAEGEEVASWLDKVRSGIVEALREAASMAMSDFEQIYQTSTGMDEFCLLKTFLKYPAQVSLLILRSSFTRTVESSFQSENAATTGLSCILSQAELLLESTVSFVMDGEYTREDPRRCNLVRSQLIKELVYQRDLLKSLVRSKVKSITSSVWDHNMRVYCERSIAGDGLKVTIRCGLFTFEYGWEYLGIGETLVHTELTTRCYLTLTESLRRGFGGSPFGPAGTGKTETVKALGRSLGRFVAVFNCDETFDSVSVGRILAGVCRIGCWVCFDEFNRLSAGILSLTGGQLASLQACIRKNEDEVQNFYGGELPIRVKPGVGVFVTMNPTYSGRRELPANLKTLFRPCSMSRPDSVAIAEVLLLSSGFRFAASLAQKMVTFFDSLQGTVSRQPHYDFGLRSLKTTILASSQLIASARHLLEKNPNSEGREEELLIRSIEEVVKPKLSSADALEYEVAIRSVFVEASSLSSELPDDLKSIVQEVMEQRNLLPTKEFMEKLRQLYWLIQHQSGVMLIGTTGSGKSAVWRTLHEALRRFSSRIHSRLKQEVSRLSRATLTVLDPKLLSISQLYGSLDRLTREWTDGLFTKTLRRINAEREEGTYHQSALHWIIFDGDVDPVWAENLNSVLDDNRILTLPNGEQIPLPDNARILFEANDLDHANPSTVSRCGMICFAEDTVAEVSMKVCLHKIYQEFCDPSTQFDSLDDVADLIVSTGKRIIDAESLVITVPLQAVVRSVSTLLHSSLEELKRSHTKENSMTVSKKRSYVPIALFVKALVVASKKSLCAGLSLSSRLIVAQDFFDEARKHASVRSVFAGIALPSDLTNITIRADGTLTDYAELVPQADNSISESDAGNPDVVIPTPTTMRLKSFLHDGLKLSSGTEGCLHPLLLCGPPGCGKSLLLTATLMEVPNVTLCPLSFSSETSHDHVLAALKGCTDISRRPNGGQIMRPKSSGYRVVLFCDEVNLEKPDVYGTQRSVSLLRSMAEHGGFWDGSSAQWVVMEGIYIVAACNPEEDAGRNKLSARFLSHCNVIRVEQPSMADMHIIYGVFVKSLLCEVNQSLASKGDCVTSGMIDFFSRNKMRFCPEERGPLLPHYIYSPRELSRWVRGMKQLLVDSNRKKIESGEGLSIKTSPKSLWKEVVLAFCYEARRLFIDRLPTTEEQKYAEDALATVAREHLKVDSSLLLDTLYTSWQAADNDEQGKDARFHIVRDPEVFRKLIYRKLRVFAEEEGLGGSWLTSGGSSTSEDSSAMIDQFAVTDEVLTHLTRIERILCNPLGHAVLMGAPGTGKKTLARFASWMLSMDVHQVHSHSSYSEEDFAQDLKKILRNAGVHGRRISLIFDESHAMESGFLEVMNSLLACGDVPGLFNREERASLIEELRSASIGGTSSTANEHTLYAEFIHRVRQNLHVVFTISSSSSSTGGTQDVSERSPALYNRCTVDWIGDWAKESLEAVAELKIEVSLGNERDQIIRSVVRLHALTQERFQDGERRVTITPRHFLEFVEQLNRLALEKGGEIHAGVERHTEGLRRLRHAGTVVDELKDSLEEKSFSLQHKEANANEMLKRMVEEQRLAEKSKVSAEQLALAAAEASAAVQARESEVADQLALVEPKVEAAREAVGSIRKEYLEELRGMPHPPSGARLALQGVMMVLDASRKKPDTQYSWGSIRTRMRGSDFISSVVNFDARNVPKGFQSRIEASILKNPDYDVDKISFASRAAGPLAEWTLAILDFVAVVEAVEPLQVEVVELHDEQEELQKQQQEANEEAERFELAIEQCKADYAMLVSEAEKIRQEIKDSELNLRRSEEMLDSLASEWDRWVQDLNEFNVAAGSVWGNSVLGAAFLSYAGALDHENRIGLWNEWKTVLNNERIPFDDKLQISIFLTSARERGFWSSVGLPTDSTSLENYAILRRSARFPLIVDPTRQNAGLLRKILDEAPVDQNVKLAADSSYNQIAETSFTSKGKKSYMRALESSMRFGTSLLLGDAESFDLAVLPLLGQESSYGDATKFAESLNPTQTKGNDSGRSRNICQRVVRLGERDVFLSPSFRMYLSAVSLDQVPQAAITRSNVVSFELSPDALGSTCISATLAILAPDIETKRKSFLVATLHNQERKRRLEEEVLATVNNVEDLGTELLRGSLLDNLSSLKKEVQILTSRQKEEEEASAEVSRFEAMYAPLGLTAIEIYSVIQRLRLFDVLYEFDTAFFVRTFEETISGFASSGKRDNDNVRDCQKLFLDRTYAAMAHRLFPRDRLPFAAALSIVTVPSMGSNNDFGNADASLEMILKAWSRSLSGQRAKSVTEQETIASVSRLLPSHLRAKFQGVEEASHDPLVPIQADLVMQVLKASLYQPNLVSKGVDDLACSLPGKDELVHGNKTSPEYALREEVTKHADSNGNNLEKSMFAPLLVCTKGSNADPSVAVTALAEERGSYLITLSMGSSSSDESVSEAVELASAKTDQGVRAVVVLKNMHLASKAAIERLIGEITTRNGQLSFLLIVTIEISTGQVISSLMGGLTFFKVLTFEALPSFRSNFSRSLGLLSTLRDGAVPSEATESMILDRLQVLLSWLHACLLERSAHNPIGFKKPYEFSDGDLSAAWDVLTRRAQMLVESTDLVGNAIKVLTHAVYGSRIESEADFEVLRALVSEAFDIHRLRSTDRESVEVFSASDPSSNILIPLEARQRMNFVRSLPLEAKPEWVHMPQLAPHRKHAREGLDAMEKTLHLILGSPREESCEENSIAHEFASVTRRTVLEEGLNLPNVPELSKGAKNDDPLHRFWVTESALLSRIVETIKEQISILLGKTSVSLRQSRKIAKLRRDLDVHGSHEEAAVPNTWRVISPFHGSAPNLSEFFSSIRHTIDCLRTHILDNERVPINLSGISRPKALIIALRYKEAARLGVAPHKLRAVLTGAEEVSSSDTLVSGISVCRALWDGQEKVFVLSEKDDISASFSLSWTSASKSNEEDTRRFLSLPLYGTRNGDYVCKIDVPVQEVESIQQWWLHGVSLSLV